MEVDLVAFAGIIVSILGVTALYFGVLSSIKERLSTLEVKIDLIWHATEGIVSDSLRHPSEPRKDILLDKMVNKTATVKELIELRGLLKSKMTKVKSPEAIATAFAIGRIDVLLWDLQKMKK